MQAQVQATPQAPAQTSANKKPNTLGTVVVSGTRPDVVSAIDRKSYNVANDLMAASGSIGDVLGNLPSVEIDAQGNPSLRGDSSVQILIDGKTSTMMSPANRAETLQSLPADMVDRVEVITNPSAAFKPDGSSGIINIITKKDRKPGTTGLLRAGAGTDGRVNLGGVLNHARGPLSISANASLRRDVPWRPYTDTRTRIDPATGTTDSHQDSLFKSERKTAAVGATVDYDVTSADRLSVGYNYSRRTGSPRIRETNTVDQSGVLVSDYDRIGSGSEVETNTEATARYRHTFAEPGREFTFDLRRGQSIEHQFRRYTNVYRTPAGLIEIDDQRPDANEIQSEATAEYKQGLAGGKLLLGYDVQRNSADYQARGDIIDPVTGQATPDPTLTNRFLYTQTTNAVYGTYGRKFVDKWSAMLGLRLENTVTDGRQVDTAQRNRKSYSRAYPTLHLQYDLSDTRNMRFSYSKRIYRPDIEDLNPYPVFSDPLNQRAGNPNLKPRETNSFEASYAFEGAITSWDATAYYRKTNNAFTVVSRFISPTVLLTTHENLGRNTATGVDFSARGKLTPTLGYKISGNINYNQFDGSNLGIPVTSGYSNSLKTGLDYQPSKRDLVQLGIQYRGRRPMAQGYQLPMTTANVGYRRTFANRSTAVLALSDLFDSARERSRIDSPILVESSIRRRSRRTLSLTYSIPLGGGKPETPTDLFESGADHQ
ncbi:outer membrane beta-barrel family protein [Solilutibacter silvestris]|uniref:outer membrane beta-barrel family protein n=1 Tax=Solilutibacter silvestris TaxID=1645665 RepID=UPI0013FE3407|nr:outer membrane beta-barrel family protein [Lysobacter silvestris]